MSLIATVLMTAAAAAGANDPIADCRAAHGSNAVEHIACLEDALRARAAAAGPAPRPRWPRLRARGRDGSACSRGGAGVTPADGPRGRAGDRAASPAGCAAEQVEVRIVSVRYTKTGLGCS